ncbi:MAG TPA: iron-siderophore ABC transporter substrate-binding protein [Acidimicrobiales bacterium]|nr:iron-siderophore ABC transporter substrate-binding protein [Acidimicrobiales bacterium]
MRRLLALLLAVGVFAACGGNDEPATTSTPSASATEDAFPVTIEHKYGTTTIESAPERVVSVGYSEQDAILALGVVPVGIRDWFGEQPQATWPWAHDLLDGAEPEVLSTTEISFEAVAALEPDLILGVTSGMTETEYDRLSQIAPTITQSGDFPDYGMPWRDAMLMIGDALGKRDDAQSMIDEIDAEYAAIRAEHPEFEGATATMSYVLDETQIGAYGPTDIRSQLLTDLGFVIPQEIVDAAGDQFWSGFSYEQIGMLDHDVLVWINGEDEINEQIKAHPLRQDLVAFAEGREVFPTELESAAASFSSVLSLPALLDTLVPKLAAAVDGDPATEVPA